MMFSRQHRACASIAAVSMPAGVTLFSMLVATSPARANCTPVAANGVTVTCTGTDTTGVGTGAENNVTVNVLQGASITVGNFTPDIYLNSGNTVTNNGTVVTGTGAFGIDGQGSNNTLINNGAITVGAGAIAMGAVAGTTGTIATNSGTIQIGDGAVGITIDGGIVTNSGTITARNSNAYGIVINGANSSATNSGAIIVGNGSFGILGGGASQAITNSGTIAIGSQSFGISAGGNGSVTNSGNIISTGTMAVGISANGAGQTIANTGSISLGDKSFAIGAVDHDTVSNSGAIRVGSFGAGIDAGSNNVIVNIGMVKTGADGTAISGFLNNTVINNGTLDGVIALTSPGNALTNSGLIAITDQGTALSLPDYSVATFTQTPKGTLGLRVNNAGASDHLVAGTANLGGTLGAVVQPGLYSASTTFTSVVTATNPIVTKFAQSQAFATGTTAPLAFFTATAAYNANAVDLTLNRTPFGAVSGETLNQQQVGNTLNASYSVNLTGNQATLYTSLLQATSVGALDMLSGEGTSGTQNMAFFANNTFATL
ncbi:MAG TPA: hypothetical protein VIY51_01775, partial [Xanthobacteraceae bacterium]